jgi:hypothetical protein
MSKAEQAAFFSSAIGENVAASFTTEKIRAEPSSEAAVQLVPGVATVFEPFPFDCGAIEYSSECGWWDGWI